MRKILVAQKVFLTVKNGSLQVSREPRKTVSQIETSQSKSTADIECSAKKNYLLRIYYQAHFALGMQVEWPIQNTTAQI
jgi:hypothetical protein